MRYMGRRHQNNYWPLQFGTRVWHLLIGSLRWSVVVGHQPPKKPILPKNGSVETRRQHFRTDYDAYCLLSQSLVVDGHG